MACSMYMMDVAANILLCTYAIVIRSLYLLADALSSVVRFSSSLIFLMLFIVS